MARIFEAWDQDGREFDTAYGTDTAGKITPDQLKATSAVVNQAASYLGVSPGRVLKGVAAIKIEPKEFTFIDLGCGKGRALLVAAQIGFREVIGVEFADELPEIAKANARIMGFDNIVVHQGDAGEYRFPSGNLLVFLHNPFWIPIMRRVVENLRAAQYQQLFVLYLTPKIPEVLDSADFLERVPAPDDRPHGMAIYRGKFT